MFLTSSRKTYVRFIYLKLAWYLTSSCKAHQLLIRYLLASTAILKEISDNTNIFVFENCLCEVLNMVTKCYWFGFPHDTVVISNSVGVLCFLINWRFVNLLHRFTFQFDHFMCLVCWNIYEFNVFYNLGLRKLEMCVCGRN